MAKPPKAYIYTEADRRAIAEGCWWDESAAGHVREFFTKFLRHSKGEWAGQPFTLMPWQWDSVVRPLFAWKRKDGTRRFRRAYVELAKKNGKSTLCAGLALYLLIGDGEPGAEVYSAASDRQQASIVHNEAGSMVRASTVLSNNCEVIPSTKRITFPRTGSYYQAISADAYRQEGLNAHGVIYDELHAQKTRLLWDTLAYAGAARRQPLAIAITTAGFNRESICWEQHRYAEQVLDGTFDDTSLLVYIAAADPEDDISDPKVWRKANPSLGVTVKEDELKDRAAEAVASAAKANAFRRYRLNIWTQQDVRWLQLDDWDACGAEIDRESLAGHGGWAALDLSSKRDLTALVFEFHDDDIYTQLEYYWSPEDTAAKRELTDHVPYRQWAKDGFLELTPGNVVDYGRVVAKTLELCERYGIDEIAVDRWQAEHAAQMFMEAGLKVVAFGQGYASMSAPTKEMEKLIVSKTLKHGNNPVTRWMVGNTAVEMDAAGNLKPSKKKSTEKIDGVVASIMALGRAMVTESAGSVYESRGMLDLDSLGAWLGDGKDE